MEVVRISNGGGENQSDPNLKHRSGRVGYWFGRRDRL